MAFILYIDPSMPVKRGRGGREAAVCHGVLILATTTCTHSRTPYIMRAEDWGWPGWAEPVYGHSLELEAFFAIFGKN